MDYCYSAEDEKNHSELSSSSSASSYQHLLLLLGIIECRSMNHKLKHCLLSENLNI